MRTSSRQITKDSASHWGRETALDWGRSDSAKGNDSARRYHIAALAWRMIEKGERVSKAVDHCGGGACGEMGMGFWLRLGS
jgi:hypothetical protein